MISIVIPTHRRSDLLQRLLDSISAQTYSDYEVIVVDDASPNVDEYLSLATKAQQRFKNFEYIRIEKNGGAPRARNMGIARAKGDWIALVDDDDEWLPRKLELQQNIAEKAPASVGLIYTWARTVDAAGRLLHDSQPNIEGRAVRQIFTGNFIMSPSVMVRRAVFGEVGGFDERLPSCQDWDMWARIMGAGFECRVVPEVVTLYHQHGQACITRSPHVLHGYRMFLDKHWLAILRYTSPTNWLRKVGSGLKLRIKIYRAGV